ncbi:MAG: LamG domain-containing protein [Verrucomicrobiota bacterium]
MKSLWYSIVLSLVLTGCGGEKSSDGDASKDEEVAATEIPRDSGADAAPSSSSPPQETTEDTEDESEEGAEVGDAATANNGDEPDLDESFEKEFQRVLELEADANFNRALAECRQLRKKYRTGPEAEAIGRKMNQLSDYSRRSGNLMYSVRKLSPESTFLERKVAREKIAEADDLGMLYLRKAVRDRLDNGVANEAAKLLISEQEHECVSFLIEQLENPPEEPLLETIIDGIVEHARQPNLPELLTLVRFRHSSASEEYREHLLEVLRRGTRRDFETGDLVSLYNQTKNDQNFDKLPIVELLALIYESTTARHDEAFNELLGGEGRLDRLRDYTERARSSEDEEIASWGAKISLALSYINFRTLREGLLAWWSFDELDGKIVPDVSGQGHHARIIAQRIPKIRKGGIGSTLHLKHSDNALVESIKTKNKAFLNLHKQGYGFAAWINPAKLPDGEQPDPYWGIVVKEGWHLGLQAQEDGSIRHTHFFQNKKDGSTAASEPVLKPGTWVHVVGSVDQEEGEVRLYINGKLVDREDVPRGRIADMYNNRLLRVGAARLGPSDYACRFSGLIDEVAIYSRALGQDDVKNIYRIRSVDLRNQLLNPPETTSEK